MIVLYPCIDVPSQAVEMMQSSKRQNQKVYIQGGGKLQYVWFSW